MPVFDIDDPNATEVVIGHDGKPVRVVRDKCVVRVPMRMRDAASVSGQIAADRQRVVDDFALHKPGVRRLSDESYDASRAAYETMVRDRSEAWRAGPGGHDIGRDSGRPELGDGQHQDARRRRKTVERDPQGRELATYEETEDAAPLSVADAERIKREAWEQCVRDAEQAWKNLGSL